LRAELGERLRQAARELGADNYLALNHQLWGRSRGCGPEPLTVAVAPLLSMTESCYLSGVGPLLSRLAGTSIDAARPADLSYLQRFTGFDHLFPGARMIEVYRELFAGLGFRVEKQANLELDTPSRPRKQARPFCSPLRVPDEIKLGLDLKGGQA